jgi:hypothetical protein
MLAADALVLSELPAKDTSTSSSVSKAYPVKEQLGRNAAAYLSTLGGAVKCEEPEPQMWLKETRAVQPLLSEQACRHPRRLRAQEHSWRQQLAKRLQGAVVLPLEV